MLHESAHIRFLVVVVFGDSLHETFGPRLVGPPGTGKTLLAKAVAGEVPTRPVFVGEFFWRDT